MVSQVFRGLAQQLLVLALLWVQPLLAAILQLTLRLGAPVSGPLFPTANI